MLFQTTPEHEALRAKIRAFAEEEIKPIAFLLDQQNEFPEDAVRKLGEMGQEPRDTWADRMTPDPPSTRASSSTAMA